MTMISSYRTTSMARQSWLESQQQSLGVELYQLFEVKPCLNPTRFGFAILDFRLIALWLVSSVSESWSAYPVLKSPLLSLQSVNPCDSKTKP